MFTVQTGIIWETHYKAAQVFGSLPYEGCSDEAAGSWTRLSSDLDTAALWGVNR